MNREYATPLAPASCPSSHDSWMAARLTELLAVHYPNIDVDRESDLALIEPVYFRSSLEPNAATRWALVAYGLANIDRWSMRKALAAMVVAVDDGFDRHNVMEVHCDGAVLIPFRLRWSQGDALRLFTACQISEAETTRWFQNLADFTN